MLNLKRLGSEFILGTIFLPVLAWIILSIIDLKASAQDKVTIEQKIDKIDQRVEYIYQRLIEEK